MEGALRTGRLRSTPPAATYFLGTDIHVRKGLSCRVHYHTRNRGTGFNDDLDVLQSRFSRVEGAHDGGGVASAGNVDVELRIG